LKVYKYIDMQQKEIINTLKIIDDLNQNFPLLPITHLDFNYLSKEFNIDKKQIYSMIAFMNWIASKNTFIDIADLKSLKVSRGGNKWVFIITGIKHSTPFTVDYEFSFLIDEE
jgi:hypothetical protein